MTLPPVRALVTLLTCLAFAAAISPVHAQQKDKRDGDHHRPTIGLVLSGGGALGVGHVGALKALEELHIPIDYVAGTSMGAIIGGLYASGMSPSDLEAWFRHADWNFLLSDSLPRESESIRTKQRQFNVNQGIAFNVSRKGGLKLPAGLVGGRNVMAGLRQLTAPVRHIHDFNQLPIPFRAVATDIETGDLVLLRQGDLAEAVRASMSVPAIFFPQRIDDRLLIDGGLANNLPIDVVQAMGADVVIAIDVSQPLKKEAELDTAPVIANQVVSILLQKQMREQRARLGPGDAFVKINIEDMGPTDFGKSAKALDTGYEGTMKERASLARYSVSPAQFQQYLARQRVPRGPVMISFLKVETPDGVYDHAVREPFEFDVKEQPKTVQMQNFINDLGELQKYDIADYEVIDRDGQVGLLVKARKKKSGPNFLNFGYRFAYSSSDPNEANLLLTYRMTELNSLGAEWRTHLSLGDTMRLLTEWYQPLDWDRRLFVAAQAFYGSDFIDGRSPNGDRLRFRLQDFTGGADVGFRLWQAGQVRVGYVGGFSRIDRRLDLPKGIPTTVDRGWMHVDVVVDTLDAANFAAHGTYGQLSVMAAREELGSSDNYTRLDGQIYQPISFGKNTIVPRVVGSLQLGGNDVPVYDQAALGGFLNLSGLTHADRYGENALLAEIVAYRKIAETTPGFSRGIYGGFSVEAGKVWNTGDFGGSSDVVFGGSIFVGADTFMGPVSLGVGVAEGGNAALYFQLAPLFRDLRQQR